jgi:hypothetical protein
MISTHLDFPTEKRSVMILIIEKPNLDRMRQADPITLESKSHGGNIMPKVMFPEALSLLIAYEEDDVELYKVCKENNALKLLKYLGRGRKWDPATDGQVSSFASPAPNLPEKPQP